MKKILIALVSLLFLSSCATLFPGKSYNRAKPKIKPKNHQVINYSESYPNTELIS